MSPHRTLRIVQHHLDQPPAATPSDALTRAVRVESTWGEMARALVNRVGTLADLEALDTSPHGDEPFDLDAVLEDDRPFVTDVLAVVDGVCGAWLDVESRTIARRLMARVLRHDPTPFRRSSRPNRVAGGVLHAVLDGNGFLGRGQTWRASDVAAWCATSSSLADVAYRLVRAANLTTAYDEPAWSWPRNVRLASPTLLHSGARAAILQERTTVVAGFLEEEQRRAGRRRMVDLGGGRLQLRGCLADVAMVDKGVSAGGQLTVVVGLAPLQPEPELELYALSVPEARRLLGLLASALDRPTPHLGWRP